MLEKVTSPKLHAQYGKAREADGHYMDAARAYEAAREFDNAVRYVVKESNTHYIDCNACTVHCMTGRDLRNGLLARELSMSCVRMLMCQPVSTLLLGISQWAYNVTCLG